ncbi:hypothetical protein A3J56_00390 [Candidatus Giovannonibacteria bacterium RIFCSPHIGHO2_02_FULL_46_20]|uniref:Type II secretion system protein J n=1 Tax=Candidatus Giovannonibacteria bacterium RIFCSPHIGHO2_02_FULL_46_20 TaxID=1798338 RepID=A0A1F5WGN1_9BACT|nr:MAG: hypothetical protein A3J56_00390 [Candidatus Giovannonibacteria bacterium RIFCSPHIGHO2_02_FULL_46_20]
MKNRGFTLIEMTVAVGVFAILASLSVGSLLMLTSAQKKAATLQSVQDNLRFALEVMTKDARFGDQYYCSNDPEDPSFPLPFQLGDANPPTDCINGGQLIAFKAIREGGASPPVVIYRLGKKDVVNSLKGRNSPSFCQNWCIEKAEGFYDDPIYSNSANAPEFFPITSKDIEINDLVFYLTGAKPIGFGDDPIEARVTIAINAEAQIGKEVSRFFLQTSSSRLREQRE